MAEMRVLRAVQGHVERISGVIDKLYEGGTSGFFMGVPIEKFDRDRLIKLISIQMAMNHQAQEKAKKDYEFLGYLDGLARRKSWQR